MSPLPPRPPIWRAGSRSTPRPCAECTCRTDAAAVATGASATLPTPLAGAFTCACGSTPARAQRVTGPTPPRASMAICSISSASHTACGCARRWSRPGLSSPSRRRRGCTGISGGQCRAIRRRLRACSGRGSRSRARRRGLPRGPRHSADGLAVAALSPILFRSRRRRGPTSNLAGALAALTDIHGAVRSVHRTWLDPSVGSRPIEAPRRSLGCQLGHGVRLGGFAAHLLVAGEGLETVLSLRSVLPHVPMVARALRQPLGRPRSARRGAAPLYRAGRGRGRNPRGGAAARASRSGRPLRGARPLSAARRLQRRPAQLGGCMAGRACGCATRPGRCPLAASLPVEEMARVA